MTDGDRGGDRGGDRCHLIFNGWSAHVHYPLHLYLHLYIFASCTLSARFTKAQVLTFLGSDFFVTAALVTFVDLLLAEAAAV